jgi:SIR2-like domain
MPGPVPEQHAALLAQKLADGQLALFVGAGLSRQALARDGSLRKLPLWAELAERVAAACHEDLATYGGNILDLFDAIVYGKSRFTLEEAVRRAIDDEAFDPSPAHEALATLPWAGVYTTNYDDLLGRVLKEKPVAEDDHYDRLQLPDDRRPRLFHVHGTLDKPHTLTRDDYRLWPETHPRAYRDLEAVVLNKTVLFVGYSLSDPHLADGLLPRVRRITAGREKRLYAWMWQVPPSQVQLLDRRDKIEAIQIERDEDWAAAFRQLSACLGTRKAKKVSPVDGADPYAYDRQQYVAAMEARYGYANLQGLYVGGAGYARTEVTLDEVFVEPDLEVTPTTALAGGGGRRSDRWHVAEFSDPA